MGITLLSMFTTVVSLNAATLSDNSKKEIYLSAVSGSSSNSGTSGRRRAPRVVTPSVEVWLWDDVITFLNYYDIDNMLVEIFDEDDNLVISETMKLQSDETEFLSIDALKDGNYTIYVTFNGVQYSSEFERMNLMHRLLNM